MTEVLITEKGYKYHKIADSDDYFQTECGTHISKEVTKLEKDVAEKTGYDACGGCF